MPGELSDLFLAKAAGERPVNSDLFSLAKEAGAGPDAEVSVRTRTEDVFGGGNMVVDKVVTGRTADVTWIAADGTRMVLTYKQGISGAWYPDGTTKTWDRASRQPTIKPTRALTEISEKIIVIPFIEPVPLVPRRKRYRAKPILPAADEPDTPPKKARRARPEEDA